jgi:TetR/AcrR family transcriptional regulator
MPEPLSSREKILDVAEALFARRGFMGVGLRELADATGLGKSSLFHHFRGKAALYCVVVGRALERIEAALAPVADSPAGPAERLERMVSLLVDHLAEHPTTARLLLRSLFEEEEFAQDPPEEAARAEAIVASLVVRMQALLREGMESGVFRRASTAHTVQTLIGATVYHFASADVGEGILGKPLFTAEAVAERKAEIVALLRHGLVAPARPCTEA